MLNGNENVKGIIIDDAEFKLTQFTDNTTFNTLEIYGRISGLKIN